MMDIVVPNTETHEKTEKIARGDADTNEWEKGM
jgi:hypothetical protein